MTVEICIDDREPKDIIAYLKRKFPDIKFVVKRLKEGDYYGRHVIVERKTVSDLHSSILDGRFISQFNRMSAIPDTLIILMVTGDLVEYIKKMRYQKINVNSQMILDTISSAHYRYGASIIWTQTDNEGLSVIIPIMESIIKGDYMNPRKASPEILLARLLQIPYKSVIELMAKYKSISAVAKAKESDLIKIRGIGEVRAKTIKKVLNGEI